MLAGNLSVSEGKRTLGHRAVIDYQSQGLAETMDPRATLFPECLDWESPIAHAGIMALEMTRPFARSSDDTVVVRET